MRASFVWEHVNNSVSRRALGNGLLAVENTPDCFLAGAGARSLIRPDARATGFGEQLGGHRPCHPISSHFRTEEGPSRSFLSSGLH